MHIKNFASEYQGVLSDAQRRGDSNIRIVSSLSSEASAFRSDVEGELKEGRLTGSKGRGVVTITLERIAEKLESMVLEVKKVSKENVAYIVAANEAYARLLVLSERNDTKPEDVKEVTERLRSSIIKISEVSPDKVVSAMLPSIEGIVNSLLQPEGEGFKLKQLEAINNHIKPRVESMLVNLEELANGESLDIGSLPSYDPITRPEAVLKYGNQFPVQWAIAIALDLSPLVFLILLVLGPNGKREDAFDELSVTVGDAIKMQHASERLRLKEGNS
jgi:hypothetical protein